MVKKPLTEQEVLDKIPRWQENYNEKSGTGVLIISSPKYRNSSYFSSKYDVNTKVLSGKLLGSFGITVGSFYFSPDSVSVIDIEGKEIKEQILYILGDLPHDVLSMFIAWDIPLSSKWRVIPLERGWVLIGNNIEVSISPEFLPYYVSIYQNNNSSIEYTSYKTVSGIKQPFRIIAKKGKNMLEIEYHKMKLQ